MTLTHNSVDIITNFDRELLYNIEHCIHHQALVMIVGEKCVDDSHTLHLCSEALSEENIVIKMLNQGSSKLSIMVGIDEIDFEKAIQCLYKKFFT